MKSRIVLQVAAAVLLVTTGCKKDAAGTASVEGSWELRKAFGMVSIDYPAGNGMVLKFTATGYQRYENGRQVQSGTYVLVTDNTVTENTCIGIAEGQYTTRIIYDTGQTAPKIFLQRDGNKLSFISGCFAYDAGHSSIYEKVAD